MNIDVRGYQENKITSIQFADQRSSYDAYKIILDGVDTTISDGGDAVYIRNTAHAKNLIKALEKAIELGTWD